MQKALLPVLAAAILSTLGCPQPASPSKPTDPGTEVPVDPPKPPSGEEPWTPPPAGESKTFVARKDVFVRGGTNGSTSYADKAPMEMKRGSGADTWNRKILLGFDLEGYAAPRVRSAKARLFMAGVIGSTAAEIAKRPFDYATLYATDGASWDEASVTWNSSPAAGPAAARTEVDRRGYDDPAKAGTWVDFDITALVNERLAAGAPLGALDFVAYYADGDRHDNGGLLIASKETAPTGGSAGDAAARIVIVEGSPDPELAVFGIPDEPVAAPSIEVRASATSPVPGDILLEVWANDRRVAPGSDGGYSIPLSVGDNRIVFRARDAAGNFTRREFSVRRVASHDAAYHVDAEAGDDANDGLSPSRAWRTLGKVNSSELLPGNAVLFKRGSAWTGQLKPRGSGAAGAPVVIGAYGSGARPIIAGMGVSSKDTGSVFPEGAVQLEGLSHVTVRDLEVTNEGKGGDDATFRGGIVALSLGQGICRNIVVRDCYVHDVDSPKESSRKNKFTGGIVFIADTRDKTGRSVGTKSGYDGILVEGCRVRNVAIEGIRTKTWHEGKDAPERRNRNVVFRNNLVEDVLGDGIVISEIAENGLVEKNVVRRHSRSDVPNLNYAGCWVWDSEDTVFQFNEVYDGEYGYMDGEAFDIDMHCSGVTYQYNYSHENSGGFSLFMGSLRGGNAFRYNASKNDGQRANQEIFHYLGSTANDAVEIHNNTIYLAPGTNVPTLFRQTSRPDGKALIRFYNNIVHADGVLGAFALTRDGKAASVLPESRVENNLFFLAGGSYAALPGRPAAHPGLVEADSGIAKPAAERQAMDSWDPAAWAANVAGFRIGAGSPARGAGVVVAGNGGRDLYGNPLPSDRADIGAHQFD